MKLQNCSAAILISATIIFAPGVASAEFVSVDGWSKGDGAMTNDTATGLQWLDLTVTNNWSINNFLANQGGLSSYGFQLASIGQVTNLFLDAGASAVQTNQMIYSAADYVAALAFMNTFGITVSGSSVAYSEGTVLSAAGGFRLAYVQTGNPGIAGNVGIFGMNGVDQIDYPGSFAHNQYGDGIFLVRDITSGLLPGTDPTSPPPPPAVTPVPPAWMLMMTAMACFLGFRQKYRVFAGA